MNCHVAPSCFWPRRSAACVHCGDPCKRLHVLSDLLTPQRRRLPAVVAARADGGDGGMSDCVTEVPTSQRQPSRLRRGDQRATVCMFAARRRRNSCMRRRAEFAQLSTLTSIRAVALGVRTPPKSAVHHCSTVGAPQIRCTRAVDNAPACVSWSGATALVKYEQALAAAPGCPCTPLEWLQPPTGPPRTACPC